VCLCLLWGGGNQIFGKLGGEVFGWELKFHEILVGGDQPQCHCDVKVENLKCLEFSIGSHENVEGGRGEQGPPGQICVQNPV
jgi:hypothetical protein